MFSVYVYMTYEIEQSVTAVLTLDANESSANPQG